MADLSNYQWRSGEKKTIFREDPLKRSVGPLPPDTPLQVRALEALRLPDVKPPCFY